MKRSIASLLFISGLLAAPLLGQTTIGGGTCNSGSLTGAYAVSLTSRQVTSSGTFSGVSQATGAATFDGLSAVTMNLTANTGQGVGTALAWSGTYSVQANCDGVINITTGGSVNLTVAINNSGTDFALGGSDAASNAYNGNGVAQPGNGNKQTATCSASTFSGVYTFNGTGFALNGTAVSGAKNAAGLLQFDGVSNVTANLTTSTTGVAPSPLTLTGSYTISSNCLGSATLTDASANSYAMNFAIYNNTVANAAAYVGLAQSSNFLMSATMHATYGQPATTTTAGGLVGSPALVAAEKPQSVSANRGGRS